jgi:type IV secretory pathway VirJ component
MTGGSRIAAHAPAPSTSDITMRPVSLVILALVAAPAALPLAARGQRPTALAPVPSPCMARDGSIIPVIERQASDGRGPLVILLTGDGGWANADQKVAEELMTRGSSVIGVNMRAYLGTKRSPDEAARDIGCVARTYGERWQRDRLLLLGYSRGADVAPFVAARWPADLRARLTMVALVSMSAKANFQYHFIDLVRDVARDDDVEINPEIARMRGLNVICVFGKEDHDSGCLKTDTTIVKRFERTGGHRLTQGFAAIAELLTPALAPAATR